LIPYVGAAPCAYKFLIRPYCSWSPFTKISNIFTEKDTDSKSDEGGKLFDVSDQTTTSTQILEKELVDFSDQIITPSQIKETKLEACQVLVSSIATHLIILRFQPFFCYF